MDGNVCSTVIIFDSIPYNSNRIDHFANAYFWIIKTIAISGVQLIGKTTKHM